HRRNQIRFPPTLSPSYPSENRPPIPETTEWQHTLTTRRTPRQTPIWTPCRKIRKIRSACRILSSRSLHLFFVPAASRPATVLWRIFPSLRRRHFQVTKELCGAYRTLRCQWNKKVPSS